MEVILQVFATVHAALVDVSERLVLTVDDMNFFVPVEVAVRPATAVLRFLFTDDVGPHANAIG